MKVKKKDLFAVQQVMDRLGAEEVNPRFGYALIKNKAKIKTEIDAIREIGKPNPAFQKYDEERVGLCKSYADKNEDGTPKVSGNSFVIADIPAFEKALAMLRETYKEVLEDQEKRVAEIDKILEEEFEVEWHRIKLSWLPETMQQSQIEILIDMIDED